MGVLVGVGPPSGVLVGDGYRQGGVLVLVGVAVAVGVGLGGA